MAYTAQGKELPQGLALMMAQDMSVIEHFNNLSQQEQQALIARAKQVESKAEMRQLVESLKTQG